MWNTAAIVALVATLALGVATGILYLMKARRGRVKTLHLVAALAASALVLAAVATAPPASLPGPAGPLPVAMVMLATAAGWGAWKLARGSRRRGELVLFFHIVLGIAGFFVFLAWAKSVSAAG
jgi:hypothetical protein